MEAARETFADRVRSIDSEGDASDACYEDNANELLNEMIRDAALETQSAFEQSLRNSGDWDGDEAFGQSHEATKTANRIYDAAFAQVESLVEAIQKNHKVQA